MMGEIKRKKLLMYILLCLTIMSLMVEINRTKAVGHGGKIISPTEGVIMTNVFRTAMTSAEKTKIKFEFEIKNHDHYYALYTTWIDGIYEKTLIDDGFNQRIVYYHGVFYYDAQSFLNRYGQGVHTFSLWLYHPYTVTVGFAEGPGPDDDVLLINGTTYRITEVSVTFTFDPPVVYYAGFWYEGNSEGKWYNFSRDILTFHDLLWSSRAHYLHGYGLCTGKWDRSPYTPFEIFKNIAKHDNDNDIVIIHFSTHGSAMILDRRQIVYKGELLEPSTYDPKHLKFGKWYKVIDFNDNLQDAHFSASTIIAIIDACYSEYFIDGGRGDGYYIPHAIPQHVTVLTSCRYNESARLIWSSGNYNTSKTLAERINEMNSYFSRALVRALYNEKDVVTAWNSLKDYDYTLYPSGKGYGDIWYERQHPIRSEFYFNYLLYFYNQN